MDDGVFRGQMPVDRGDGLAWFSCWETNRYLGLEDFESPFFRGRSQAFEVRATFIKSPDGDALVGNSVGCRLNLPETYDDWRGEGERQRCCRPRGTGGRSSASGGRRTDVV
jgi:hypothetical protein